MKQDPVRNLDKKLEINGKIIDVKVEIFVSEDNLKPQDTFDFGDESENCSYLELFSSGQLFMALVQVRATALGLGIDASDYLGGCHMHANNYFDPSKFSKDLDNIVSDHEMVETALTELKKEIVTHANLLKPFATRGLK